MKANGTLRCGVSTGLVGFAAPDANGEWQGFDVALCRAVAAAVQRKRAVGDGLEEGGLQEDLLDIPAFLRRQAD